MSGSEGLPLLADLLGSGLVDYRVSFRTHAIKRMFERSISIDELQRALAEGVVIREYADDKPLPSMLVLGRTTQQRPLHAVVAFDKGNAVLYVITAYEPALDDWHDDFVTRRE